jgi:DNA modification methylase
MAMIPDKSVDLIVIDPPYNIGKDKRWDKWKTVDEYVNWMTGVFKECERVLKDNGSFYWFHNDMEQIRKLMDAVDTNTSFVYKQLITWNKIDPSFKNYGYVQQRLSIDMMRNYYNGFTEYCVYYTFQDDGGRNSVAQAVVRDYLRQELRKFGKASDINRLFWANGWAKEGSNIASHFFGENDQNCLPTEPNYERLQTTGYFNKPYEDLKDEFEQALYAFNTARVKDSLRANSNVWLYPPAKNLGHITPKPVEMLENIIRHSSNNGDVVLDCFMGSGTTAVASARLNRNFIGFERESEYVRIANQRLEAVQDEIAERKLTE